MPHASAIVVGAGIVGLALARAIALRGVRVVVFERSERAVGASLRNAGAISLIGVSSARELDRARRSRAVWREFCEAADVWHDPCGSLVPAGDADEWTLLQDYAAAHGVSHDCTVLDAAAARKRSPWLATRQLRGALFSPDDLLVDPRVALRRLPLWLTERHEIEFRWKHAVTRIAYPYVWSGGRRHAADIIYLAGGVDTAELLPDSASAPLAHRRLLVRLAAQPDGFRLGAIVSNAAALADAMPDHAVAARLRGAVPGLRLVQGGSGELLLDAGPADTDVDAVTGLRPALDALRRLVELPDAHSAQVWALPQVGASDAASAVEVAPGVVAVAAPGRSGLGMTTAFGFAEDLVAGALRATAGEATLSARRA
jgi:glycine/D-amino acid oxidase-like deaminating enzyme